MREQLNEPWVSRMADILVFEILEQMSGIRVKTGCERASAEETMDTVYGLIDGEYRMELRFRAQPSMFRRLTENMMGEPPQEEDVRDYAEEFFNVLCGRFVSEIYRTTKMKGRFLPTQYGKPLKVLAAEEWSSSCTRCFVSEEKELAEFSWHFAESEEE